MTVLRMTLSSRKVHSEKPEILDVVLIAHGTLPDQKEVESDYAAIEQVLHTNFLTYASLLTVFANYFEEQKDGVPSPPLLLSLETAVAAVTMCMDAAKAGASAFVDGLRGRLTAVGSACSEHQTWNGGYPHDSSL